MIYCARCDRDEVQEQGQICGTCGDALRERADEEEAERRHEAEQNAPGVVLMPDWNEDEFPF